MRVGLDLDGTIYHWTKAAIEIATEISGKELMDPSEEPSSWDAIKEAYGGEIYEKLWEGDTIREMFSRALPYFGAHNFVHALMKHHDVRVITLRPPEVRAATIHRWLLDFYQEPVPSFFFPTGGIVSKRELDCDVYIDDHPESDKLYAACDGLVILLDKPYNQEVKMALRVFDYLGVMNAIAAIERGEL